MQLSNLGLSLVPEPYKQIRGACNCPDWMRPCKHILAVMFAFALELEHDPLALLRIRGIAEIDPVPEPSEEPAPPIEEPLLMDPARFWEASGDLDDLVQRIGLPESTERKKYLKRLGLLTFWGGSFDLSPLSRDLYEAVRAYRTRGLASSETPVEPD